MNESTTQVAPTQDALTLLHVITTLKTVFDLISQVYDSLEPHQNKQTDKLLEASGLTHGLYEQFDDLIEIDVDTDMAEGEIAIHLNKTESQDY